MKGVRQAAKRDVVVGMPSINREPSILYIGEHNPYGEAYGGALRSRLVVDALRTVGRVRFVPVSRHAWDAAALAQRAPGFEVVGQIHVGPVPGEGWRQLLRRGVDSRCMNTNGLVADAAGRGRVGEYVKESDLVWIHEVACANALRMWRWPRTILDADNLASRFHAAEASSLRSAVCLRARLRCVAWRRRESRLDERFDDVVVCSDDDRRYLRLKSRVHVVPNSIAMPETPIVRPQATGRPRFGFIGTLGYGPNRDAVEWFGRHVWPHVIQALPGAEFRIVGRGGPAFVHDRRLPGIALGYVEDPGGEMATWTAMVVPVRLGAGTRVKIGEAFVRRVPVIATQLGAFGYDVVHEREIMLADTPTDFARACVRVYSEPAAVKGLIERAVALYEAQYATPIVRAQIARIALGVLELDGVRQEGRKGEAARR